MYPKEMKPGLICNVLFSLFIDYVNEMEQTDNFVKEDENKKYHIVEGASHLLNANLIKIKIEKMWGLKQDLLVGLFVYLHSLDDYFNPKLNTKD